MDGNAPNTDRLETLPLADVDESLTNPRKHFDQAKLAELAEDLKANGLTQPVVVRPRPGGRYELVVGARRTRASKIAGLTTILAIVRDLSDREVLEKQLSENAQRQDVHPLEELDGYAQLIDLHHATVEEVAAKVGKPVNYIRHRLQYRALCPEAREAFFEGKLNVATALLVARIPVAKLQMQAVAEIAVPDWQGEVMGVRRAGEHIRGRYMLQLANAPFDRGDATLVPTAGACTNCPKRTGHQPELFADVKSPDTCTDPECFGSKKDAHWKALAAEAKAKGQAVLAEKDAKKVFSYGGSVSHESDFVDLAEKPYHLGEGRKTYKGLLGKANVPPVTIARDTEGNVHELVKKTDLQKALKTAGVSTKSASSDDDYKAQQKRAREKQAQQRTVVNAAIAQLVEAAEKKAPTDALWAYLAETFVRASWHDVLCDVAKRRDLRAPVKKGGHAGTVTAEQLLTDAIKTMKPAAHRALVIEVLATRGAVPGNYGGEKYGANMLGACTLYGVDFAKIEATVKASHAAEKKAKGKKAKKKSSAPKTSRAAARPAEEEAADDDDDGPDGDGDQPDEDPVDVPEVRVWVNAAAFDALDDIAQAVLEEPYEGSAVTWSPRDRWMSALVPADEVLAALRAECLRMGLALHEGAEPPALQAAAPVAPRELVHGLGAGDHIQLDGIAVELLAVDAEGLTWRTTEADPLVREEGTTEWEAIEHIAADVWRARKAPDPQIRLHLSEEVWQRLNGKQGKLMCPTLGVSVPAIRPAGALHRQLGPMTPAEATAVRAAAVELGVELSDDPPAVVAAENPTMVTLRVRRSDWLTHRSGLRDTAKAPLHKLWEPEGDDRVASVARGSDVLAKVLTYCKEQRVTLFVDGAQFSPEKPATPAAQPRAKKAARS